MRLIINLTQHLASSEQKEVGVVDLPEVYANKLKELLTFNSLPTKEEVYSRASKICDLVIEFLSDHLSPVREETEELLNNGGTLHPLNLGFMLGGAPYLMGILENKISERLGIPMYAFTKRVVKEEKLTDGSVKKTAVFNHEGFVILD